MRGANIPAGNQQFVDTGLVYNEVLSNAHTTVNIPEYATLRVRAVANSIVSIDGVTSMSLLAGEVEYFNSGQAFLTPLTKTVAFSFTGNVYAQVGREI